MKKFLVGIIFGILLIFLFLYFGGGRALQTLGKKTIELGERIEIYEKALKDVTQGLIKKKEEIEKEIIRK